MKRRKPYDPIFSSTPARIIDPAVGAWTCASGSQVWTGHIGILTAMLAKKASHSQVRSEEHTSELQSLMRISYAVFCLKKKILHKFIDLNNETGRQIFNGKNIINNYNAKKLNSNKRERVYNQVQEHKN